MKVKKYAVYKGESFVCVGTILQCAQHMGVRLETVKFYKTPAYKRRVVERKNARNYITVTELEEEEE